MISNNNNYLNLSPYTIPGRWYRVFIESDGVDIKVTSADVHGTIYNSNDNTVVIPGKRAMDCKIDCHFTSPDSLMVTYGYDGTNTMVYLNDAGNFDYAYIYIFACEDA